MLDLLDLPDLRDLGDLRDLVSLVDLQDLSIGKIAIGIGVQDDDGLFARGGLDGDGGFLGAISVPVQVTPGSTSRSAAWLVFRSVALPDSDAVPHLVRCI